MDINQRDSDILDIALSFLVMFCSVFIGTAIFMFFDKGIGVWQFPVFSFAGMMIYSFLRFSEDESFGLRKGILYFLIYILVVSVLALIVQNVWDPSIDGRWYHSEAVIRLTDGWNPVYYKLENVGKWSYYYCKATWYTAANIAEFLGDPERGKVYNVFFELVTVIISLPFFRRFFNTKNYVIPAMGAVLMFLNPVAWSQRFTFYQDSTLGLLLMDVIMLSFFVWRDKNGKYRKSNLMALFCAAAFLSNVKFTGLAYASVYLFVFLILFFVTRERKQAMKLLGFLAVSFVVITMLLGYSPYVKNAVEEGNPFYPLMGKDAEDIMTPNTPEALKDMNYLQKFVASQYLPPNNDLSEEYSFESGDLFEMKDRKNYAEPDPRIRGFGILSFALVPMTLILAVIYLFLNGRNKKFFFVIFFSVILVGVVSKEIWWARYFSYFWIMPALVMCAFFNNEGTLHRFFGSLLFIVVFVNGVHYMVNSVPYQIEKSDITKLEVEDVRLNGTVDFLYDVLNRNHFRLWYREKLGYPLSGVIEKEDIIKKKEEDMKDVKAINERIEMLKERTQLDDDDLEEKRNN